MFDTFMCKYHAPCGLCTYYDKKCDEICGKKVNEPKITNRCDAYRLENGKPVCFGTKDKDPCTCGGDRKKCDFYDYVREEAV